MTELKGSLWCCPACGFEGEPGKPADPFEKRDTQLQFWVILLLPSVLALVSFVAGGAENGTGLIPGVLALLVGFVASIFCGIWLAKRFFGSTGLRFLFGLIFVLGIEFVNFMIVCAGCAGKIKFWNG